MKSYWLSSLLLASTLGTSGIALAADPDPSGPRPGTTYKVRKGDTCVSIVMRAYNDRRRIELMHKANPGLGPMPHYLAEGTELVLPLPTAPPTASPDAKLGAVRNVVRVEVPESKPGKVDEPLYRGNRVSTEQRSGADVLFRDESQLRLGEKTLVIILGDSKRRTREVSQDTTLVSGELTARLDKLGTIATEGAAASVKGEARISVDAKRTTRVAASTGSTTLRAQKKTVTVKAGFGSKAELGKAPTAPKPLPPAPTWVGTWPTLAMSPKGATTSVRGELAPAAANISGVRVQVARDAAFRDLVSDVFVPKTTTHIEAEGLVPGSYFVRVANVDDDDFVGLFAAPSSVQVVGYRQDKRADGTLAIVPDDDSVRCSEVGATTGTTRTTRCVSADGARQTDVVWNAPPGSKPVVQKEAPPAKAEPTPPVAPVAPLPENGFEVGAAIGLGLGWKADQPGFVAGVDGRYAVPLGPGSLVVGAALGFEGYPRSERGGVRFASQKPGRVDVSHVDLTVGLPIAYRFGGQRASLMPILQVQPELLFQQATYSGAAIGPETSAGATLFGVRGTVGTQVRLGPWALTGEGGFRVTTGPKDASAPFRGPLFLFGLRRFF